MFLYNGIFVKSDVISNETILYQRGTFIFLVCFTNAFVLLIVYSEVPNSDNNLAKYLTL